jgi:hypothetical protein
MVIRAEADPPLTEPVRVQLVRYKPEETVMIESGRERGQAVDLSQHRHLVGAAGRLVGQAPLELTAPVAGDDAACGDRADRGAGRDSGGGAGRLT